MECVTPLPPTLTVAFDVCKQRSGKATLVQGHSRDRSVYKWGRYRLRTLVAEPSSPQPPEMVDDEYPHTPKGTVIWVNSDPHLSLSGARGGSRRLVTFSINSVLGDAREARD